MAPRTLSQQLTRAPAGRALFVRRRIEELLGAGLFALGLFTALALASYAPDDPSWNVATAAVARNLAGRPGSYAADVLLQTLGVVAWLPVLALAAWAWRVASHRGLRLWLAMALLPIALIAGAAALGVVPAPDGWPLAGGIGGFIGHLAWREASALIAANATPFGGSVYALGLGLPAMAAAAASLGLGADEWRWLGRAVGRPGGALWRIVHGAAPAAEPRIARAPRRGRAVVRREPRLYGADDGEAEAAPAVLPDEPAPARVRQTRSRTKRPKRAEAERQPTLDLAPEGAFQLPPLNLLAPPRERPPMASEDALEQNARLLEAVLDDFGVKGEITSVRPGPVITLYELEPARGTKTSRVVGLADDIARSMSAVSVRCAVIPGRNAIGIELPNAERETVFLRELLATAAYEDAPGKLTLSLGNDIAGAPVIADLARMPHLLIAGTTGSGKSVAVNTMILSLLYRLTPAQCRFVMIDPKMLELSAYDGIPHLLAPVVTDPGKAVVALKWTVREMEERYRALSKLGVRNIEGYNLRLAEARAAGEELKRTVQTGFDRETGEPIFEEQPLDLNPLPSIVVVVDEMADLMLLAGKDIEGAVQRLSQMARAAGIHLIMATQRPSVDVITGTIKANFPTRISFQVTSKIDSRTILGDPGAEQLLGAGDMLFMASGGRITRVHGPYVTEAEVDRVVSFLKAQGTPDYLEEVTEETDVALGADLADGPSDELYDQALELVCRERKASTSFVQRHLQIGYNRAARIIERMESEGVVSSANHVGRREVLARDIDGGD